MKQFRLFHSRSDVYRALQLFFITSSTLIAIRFAFPGLLYVPWLFPLITFWAFVLMIVSMYFGQTAVQEEEEEERYAVQTAAAETDTTNQAIEGLKLRKMVRKEHYWNDEDFV